MSIALAANKFYYPHKHLLGIKALSPARSSGCSTWRMRKRILTARSRKKRDILRGRTQINLFFESSTRTQSSFEMAGKRLGADVMNMAVKSSSIEKGETLLDTAMTLNAMRPDMLVVRHTPPERSSCYPRRSIAR